MQGHRRFQNHGFQKCLLKYLDKKLPWFSNWKTPLLPFFCQNMSALSYVRSFKLYLLLQEFEYCIVINKPHEIIVNTSFCLCVCFFLYVSMQ
jgi:hypothetical protein